MIDPVSAAARRRARRVRYALPISIAAALACLGLYAVDARDGPAFVQTLGFAVGISGAIAPIVADDWDPRQGPIANLWVWACVVAIGTAFAVLRMPDARGPLLAVPMLLAIGSAWPIAWLYRQRDAHRAAQARKQARAEKQSPTEIS